MELEEVLVSECMVRPELRKKQSKAIFFVMSNSTRCKQDAEFARRLHLIFQCYSISLEIGVNKPYSNG